MGMSLSSHHVLLGPASDPSLTPIDGDLHPVSFGVTDSMSVLPLEDVDLLAVVGMERRSSTGKTSSSVVHSSKRSWNMSGADGQLRFLLCILLLGLEIRIFRFKFFNGFKYQVCPLFAVVVATPQLVAMPT
ncbi:hypothetical protein BHM03_00060115 [Ensete ventricosum]|nr:hypothetical protein BHM03_00060115 [Ensete ventricosum]